MSASCPHLAWAGSGCMELTGWPDRPPVAPAAPVLDRLAAVAADLADRSARGGRRVTVDLAVALSARAATLGLTRGGRVSANGSCRLLRTRRGWLACNLARAADRDAVGALVGAAVAGDPWDALAGAAGRFDGRELLATGRALGLAVAWLPDPPAPAHRRPGARLPSSGGSSSGGSSSAGIAAPVHAGRLGAAVGPRGPAELTVVDLSSLWAGPSCSRLLGLAGARVVKVESESRPDGARYGPPGWWRWLHDGHESRVVDFASPDGRAELRRWLEAADVVIEASRPRALAQLGLAPGSLRLRPGCTWLSITGHGRRGDAAMWVGFGDDASVAGGLVAWDDGGPVFCGDAIADPATGLVAADAVVRSAAAGGGRLLAVDLAGVAGWLAAPAAEACPGPHRTRPSPHGWEAVCGDGPRARTAAVLPPAPLPTP